MRRGEISVLARPFDFAHNVGRTDLIFRCQKSVLYRNALAVGRYRVPEPPPGPAKVIFVRPAERGKITPGEHVANEATWVDGRKVSL